MCKKSIALLLLIIFTCYQLIAQGVGKALEFYSADVRFFNYKKNHQRRQPDHRCYGFAGVWGLLA